MRGLTASYSQEAMSGCLNHPNLSPRNVTWTLRRTLLDSHSNLLIVMMLSYSKR